MHKYLAIFNGKRIEIQAESLWGATQKARETLKVPKSKFGLLSVHLIETSDGNTITHVVD